MQLDLDLLQRHRLDNGLQVNLLREGSLPLVAVNLWYHVGSKNERPGRTGFAHLFEHMLFQGSQNVGTSEHFEHVQRVGGVANGSTWYDRTNYYETLPAHELDLGLWLESDRMGFLLPAMTSEKLENQRDVVMNERKQRVDNQPYGRAGERVHELLYPGDHPYHWPVIGYMEDIEAATLDDVREFFRAFYNPRNCVLTLVGDFEESDALDRVGRYFGDIEPGPTPRPVAAGRPAVTAAREELTDRVQLGRVYLAYCIESTQTDEWYAATLLSDILTAGRASRLHRQLVYERQLAQSVGAFASPTEECSTFMVAATAKPEDDAAELEEALLRELESVCDAGVTRAELERARNGRLLAHHSQLQTRDRVADLLSQASTFLGDPTRAFEAPDAFEAVTPEHIQTFARERLRADQGIRILVRPESP